MILEFLEHIIKENNSQNKFWDTEYRSDAIGRLGKQQNEDDVKYFGFRAHMPAKMFLELTDSVDRDLDTSKMKEFHENGKVFANPWIDLEYDPSGDGKWTVYGHEGRHRVKYFLETYGNKVISVDVTTRSVNGELRNRGLKPEMFDGKFIYSQFDGILITPIQKIVDHKYLPFRDRDSDFFGYDIKKRFRKGQEGVEPKDEKPKDEKSSDNHNNYLDDLIDSFDE